MADVYAIFGTLLGMGIAFPGMLTAWRLLFPKVVTNAQARIAITPWKCFWLGVGGNIAFAIPITILFALSVGPAQFLGFIGLFAWLTFASFGAAGVAAHMGSRISEMTQNNVSDMGAFVRGAVAFELAAAFPVLGWFIVIPLGIILSVGAAIFGILKWQPRMKTRALPHPLDTELRHDPQSA